MTPLQNVININDPSILWGDLSPLYRGYQLSNTGLVRSMKFFHKFHYGVLIDQRKDGTYELSNSSNQRVLVSIDELKIIAGEISRQNQNAVVKIYQIISVLDGDRQFRIADNPIWTTQVKNDDDHR